MPRDLGAGCQGGNVQAEEDEEGGGQVWVVHRGQGSLAPEQLHGMKTNGRAWRERVGCSVWVTVEFNPCPALRRASWDSGKQWER